MATQGSPLGVRVPIGPFDEAPGHLGLLLAAELEGGGGSADAGVAHRARVHWLVDNLERADVALGLWDRRVVELVAALGPAASQAFIGLVMRSWPAPPGRRGRTPSGRPAG